MSTNKIGTLCVVGGGNMGGALLSRWCAAGIAEKIFLIDPADVDAPDGASHVRDFAGIDGTADVVVVAVKPDLAADVLTELTPLLTEHTIIVSIMAGLPLPAMSKHVSTGKLVRAMPNTPCKVGAGVTGLFTEQLSGIERTNISALFDVTGATHWLSEEVQFDALTAVSGSGPAYVFRMVEALAAAGEGVGLEPELARLLSRQTIIGAGALLADDAREARELRAAVTSPNGTTEAGLEALDADPGLPAVIRAAVRAAATRSREISNED
ncbi:pyrroline-5-carboxylate reductase [Pacificimonas sp. ICDLI1SI03]